MVELQQLMAQGFDPMSLYGLAGIPSLESFINYLKAQWGLPSDLAALTALGLGIIVNVWLGMALGNNFQSSMIVGVIVGISTPAWYELTKMPKPVTDTTNVVVKN